MTSPPVVLGLRRNRDFTLLWWGEGVSVLGNATTVVLVPLLAVTGLGAGAGWVGVLTAAAWLPWLLVGLPAGAWIDERSPRRVMIAADLTAAATLISVPLAWFAGALTLPHLATAALLNGVSTVFFRTAYVKLVTAVVDPSQLEAANGRLMGTESAMQIGGQGLAGLLVRLVGAVGGLVVDVVSFLVSAACLWRIHTPDTEQRTAPPEPLVARIRAGITAVVHDPYLRALTVIGGASNFGLTGINTLTVIFCLRSLDLQPSLVGYVLAIGSTGAVVGATVARRISVRWGSGRASTWLLVSSGLSGLLVPLATPDAGVIWFVLGMFALGLSVVAGNVVRGAWRQRYVPAPMLARVVTTTQMINYGTMPAAALTAGVLGESLGLRATLVIMAVINALACASVVATRLGPLRELPTRGDLGTLTAGA
ncbi:MFS transporter [Janibacter sp. GS2]|uniref:MFS transporter n=1 Tax=Janibacter sp. GS2 TaxID=3442646 RepID=UPI003EBDD8AB